MKPILLAMTGVCACLCALPAAAQTAPARPARPVVLRSVDPAKLPMVFSVKVTVADLDRAAKFYTALGATGVEQAPNPAERIVHFKSGTDIVLVKGAPAAAGAAPAHGAGGFILQTLDIDGVMARLAGAGGTVVRPPNDGKAPQSYGVRAAQIRDPDGVDIEVIQFPPAK